MFLLKESDSSMKIRIKLLLKSLVKQFYTLFNPLQLLISIFYVIAPVVFLSQPTWIGIINSELTLNEIMVISSVSISGLCLTSISIFNFFPRLKGKINHSNACVLASYILFVSLTHGFLRWQSWEVINLIIISSSIIIISNIILLLFHVILFENEYRSFRLISALIPISPAFLILIIVWLQIIGLEESIGIKKISVIKGNRDRSLKNAFDYDNKTVWTPNLNNTEKEIFEIEYTCPYNISRIQIETIKHIQTAINSSIQIKIESNDQTIKYFELNTNRSLYNISLNSDSTKNIKFEISSKNQIAINSIEFIRISTYRIRNRWRETNPSDIQFCDDFFTEPLFPEIVFAPESHKN